MSCYKDAIRILEKLDETLATNLCKAMLALEPAPDLREAELEAHNGRKIQAIKDEVEYLIDTEFLDNLEEKGNDSV
jgi:hypothetical protein